MCSFLFFEGISYSHYSLLPNKGSHVLQRCCILYRAVSFQSVDSFYQMCLIEIVVEWCYSETCSCDHLYSETTSIQGPLGHVPIVTLQCIFTSIKRPPLFKDHFFWPKRGRLIQVSLYGVQYRTVHKFLSPILHVRVPLYKQWPVKSMHQGTHSYTHYSTGHSGHGI